MKVVIVTGVGFHKDLTDVNYFANKIREKICCETEIYCWSHEIPYPQNDLALQPLRKYVAEVILDFQQALLSWSTINVPVGDYYAGHSAGTCILAAKNLGPSVFMASPVRLISTLNCNDKDNSPILNSFIRVMSSYEKPLLNIMNSYDIVAYPVIFPNSENIVYKGSWYNLSTYFPLTAHSDYWRSKFVINKAIEKIKQWSINANIG